MRVIRHLKAHYKGFHILAYIHQLPAFTLKLLGEICATVLFLHSFSLMASKWLEISATNHIYSERARQGLQFIRGNHAAVSYRFPARGR